MTAPITNVRDAVLNGPMSAECRPENTSKCVTCGKIMSGIWNTVCHGCGDTSCYDHSFARDGKWFCDKCY